MDFIPARQHSRTRVCVPTQRATISLTKDFMRNQPATLKYTIHDAAKKITLERANLNLNSVLTEYQENNTALSKENSLLVRCNTIFENTNKSHKDAIFIDEARTKERKDATLTTERPSIAPKKRKAHQNAGVKRLKQTDANKDPSVAREPAVKKPRLNIRERILMEGDRLQHGFIGQRPGKYVRKNIPGIKEKVPATGTCQQQEGSALKAKTNEMPSKASASRLERLIGLGLSSSDEE